jgi:hypothetical protein
MCLAPHLDGYRRVWMFPRNIRRVYPWKMSEILWLFNQTNAGDWSSDRAVQDSFYGMLEQAGLKRVGSQRDINDGGARTYLAQAKCLGLIFQNSERRLFPTLAGEALMRGENGTQVMQLALLRHQYPSSYSQGPNVRINPYLCVKPFIFVLQLLNHEDIQYLTTEELQIPVLYGHSHNCLDYCVDKILQLRSGRELLDVIDDVELDLYMPRSRNSDLQRKLNNVRHIANTCKNYLVPCYLVSTETVGNVEAMVFNEHARAVYEQELQQVEVFIPVHSEEQFQRRYGRWNRQRDSRNLVSDSISPGDLVDDIIRSNYFRLCRERMVSGIPHEFIESLHHNLGFSRQQIVDAVAPYVEQTLEHFEIAFLDMARGGLSTSTDFEMAVCNLFQDRFFFEATHTGARSRPLGMIGGYADGFLVALDNRHCALVDAKASPGYALSHADYNAMCHTYIPNYRELTNGRELDLEFCLYVAYGFRGNIDERLTQLSASNVEQVPVSAITAGDLLALANTVTSESQQRNLRTGFSQRRIVSLLDFAI